LPAGARVLVRRPHDVVERVALDGDAAGVADPAHELRALHLLRRLRARVVVDVLLDHGPVDVIGPERQRELGDRDAEHDPVGLDVRDVVEHEAPDGDLAQLVERARPREMRPLVVLGVERERDVGLEAARLVLQAPQAIEVVELLLLRLDVAVQHRAVRAQACAVHGARDVEPALAADLQAVAGLVYALGEHLRAAARARVEARGLELLEHLGERLSRHPRDLVELDHRERLHVDRGPRGLHRAQELEVVRVGDRRPHAGDHVHLGHGLVELRADLRCCLLGRQPERPLLTGQAVEGAERAELVAVVRVVDVLVDVEVCEVAVAPLARAVGELADGVEVGAVEREAVLEVEARAGQHLLGDRGQPGLARAGQQGVVPVTHQPDSIGRSRRDPESTVTGPPAGIARRR
jgi:hypothetical protein